MTYLDPTVGSKVPFTIYCIEVEGPVGPSTYSIGDFYIRVMS
jgi:hypothetical protein